MDLVFPSPWMRPGGEAPADVRAHPYRCPWGRRGVTRPAVPPLPPATRPGPAAAEAGHRQGLRLLGQAGSSGRHLVVDPGVRLLQPVAQARARRPTQEALDPRVIAVAPVDPLGGVEVVAPLQLDSGDVLDEVDEPVDADQLVAAEVKRLGDVAV